MFYRDERLALFIDGSNLYAAAKALGFDIDYKLLRQEFMRRGKLLRAFYYTALLENEEYSPIRPLVDWLHYNGFAMVTKPAKEYTDSQGRRKVKGNMDIELAVDAMELAPRVDHIVLFSGDGDFKPLVESLQRQGVRVSVVSTIRSQPPMIADGAARSDRAPAARAAGIPGPPRRGRAFARGGRGVMPGQARPAPVLSAERLRIGVETVVPRDDAWRPGALDVGEHGDDLGIAQYVPEPCHVAPVAAADDGFGPVLGDLEQQGVGMMPGVPSRVMRRRGKEPLCIRDAPVGLAFEVCAVAGGAMVRIDRAAVGDDQRVPVGEEACRLLRAEGGERERRREAEGREAAGKDRVFHGSSVFALRQSRFPRRNVKSRLRERGRRLSWRLTEPEDRAP